MAARKSSPRKIRLLKKTKQTAPVPLGLFSEQREVLEQIQNVEAGDQLMWR